MSLNLHPGSKNNIPISLNVTCMDRNDFLVRSIPSWLALPVDEIIVIDWSSKNPVYEDLKERIMPEFDLSRVKVCRVEGEQVYHMGKSRNLAVSCCRHDWLFNVDADIEVASNIFDLISFRADQFYRGYRHRFAPGTPGTSFFHRSVWNAVGGFNEDIHGYSGIVINTYLRMKEAGFKVRIFPPGAIKHFPHSDELRVENLGIGGVENICINGKSNLENNSWTSQSTKYSATYSIHCF